MSAAGQFTLDPTAIKGTEIPHPGMQGKTLMKASATKLVYTVKENPELLVKAIQRDAKTTTSKIYREIELQKRAAAHPPLVKRVPKVHNMIWKDSYMIVTMDKMPGMSLADYFGEGSDKIKTTEKATSPELIWGQIRVIVTVLRKIGILYFDITGYNFMFSDPYVSVIDFGHAEDLDLNLLNKRVDALNTFLQGENEWISL
jgi:serine/threonine protein kinase